MGFASASFGTVGVNKPINIIQTCTNCSYINITTVQNPESQIILFNVQMTKIGSSYNYTIPSQRLLGRYTICGNGDINGVNTAWCDYLDVTADGIPRDTFPVALYLAIGSIAFFVLGYISKLNSLLIFSGINMLIFGVVTLYPGYGFVNYDTLIGITIGSCCIGLGFLMIILPSFKKKEYEEVEVEYED
jgi:hypothetical protein